MKKLVITIRRKLVLVLMAWAVNAAACCSEELPCYWKQGSPEQFLWEYRAAADAGMQSFCTSSLLPSDPLGTLLTYHCYGGHVLSSERRAAQVRDETHAAGQKFWYYCTGCYSGQIGNQYCNRYASGWLLFRSGADGLMSWTFQRPIGNALDDFYAAEIGQQCTTYADPRHPGDNLDTPQWEGLRQGWIDYRYAAALAPLAKNNPALAAKMKKLIEVAPWNDTQFVDERFVLDDRVANRQCDQWCATIAQWIEESRRER